MENKQTAVEWLKFQINSIQFQDPAAGELYLEIQPLIEQAKAMEKEQIVSAFEHVDFNLDDGLHYYEQTYESKTNI